MSADSAVREGPVRRKQVSVSPAREANARLVAEYFATVGQLTSEIAPAAQQMFYDFAHLKKGETIMDCKTQEEWAQEYAGRTARALRYMFQGGNKNRKPTRPTGDSEQERKNDHEPAHPWRTSNKTVTAILADAITLRKDVYSLVSQLDDTLAAIGESSELDPETQLLLSE